MEAFFFLFPLAGLACPAASTVPSHTKCGKQSSILLIVFVHCLNKGKGLDTRETMVSGGLGL